MVDLSVYADVSEKELTEELESRIECNEVKAHLILTEEQVSELFYTESQFLHTTCPTILRSGFFLLIAQVDL